MNRDCQVMTRYLLGQLTEGETEELEEAYFLDDDLFDQLRDVEEDLIEAFVAGELPDSDRQAYETQLAASPRRRSRVEFHRLLNSEAARLRKGDSAPTAAPPVEAPLQGPWRSRLAKAFPIAAGILLALAVANLLIDRGKLQQRDTTIAEQESRITLLEERLQAAPEEIRHTLTLRDTVRGEGTLPQLTISPSAGRGQSISVQVELAHSRVVDTSFRVVISPPTPGGQIVFHRIRPIDSEGRRLSLPLNPALLPPGSYRLSVHGERAEEGLPPRSYGSGILKVGSAEETPVN